MADSVEEIKDRLDIVSFITQYVQLKKTGANYKGLCPFHSEKTPSFVVSPEKQIFHCFGCNKGGDVFTFFQELEGVSFPEAIEILAERAGVKLEKNFSKKMGGVGVDEKEEYFKAHNLACEFFEKQLYSTNDGEKVVEYLHNRGLKDETIKEFRLGFAPDKYDELYPFLLKKGVSKKVLIKSGLVFAKNLASDEIFDKYRARLICPIFDSFGRVCGFGARALKKDQMPKYINSPENLIYNKSKVLYGFSSAKDAIKKEGKVVIVEGYFDVILPYQAGIKNVVASSGTALTVQQARLLKRITSNVVTCFDCDGAGFEATKRAYSLLHEQNMFVKVVKDLGAKDPADFVFEKGKEFAEKIDKAEDFLNVYLEKLVKEHNLNTSEGRRGILGTLLPYYKKLLPSDRDLYVRQLSQKTGMKEQDVYDEIDHFALPAEHPARDDGEKAIQVPKKSLSELICALLLQYPKLFVDLVPESGPILDEKDFEDEMKSVYKELLNQYNSSRDKFEKWNKKSNFFVKIKEKINVLSLYAEERYAIFSEIALKEELQKLIERMRNEVRTGRLSELQIKIKEAEEARDNDRLIKLLSEQQEILSK